MSRSFLHPYCKHISILAIVGLSLLNMVLGQNLLPNPDFENFSSCPDANSQLDRCDDWFEFSPSVDYYNCGYTGNPSIRGTPSSGNGCVGFWAQPLNNGACPGGNPPFFKETLAANLLSVLEIDSTYRVSFDLMIDGLGSFGFGPNSCANFGFLFYKSASPPAIDECECESFIPQILISADSVLQGTYKSFSLTFVADDNYDAVIVGPFCSDDSDSSICTSPGPNRMYFNLDRSYVAKDTVKIDTPIIIMTDTPNASFGISDTVICINECIEIFDSSSGDEWSWILNSDSILSTDSGFNILCIQESGSFKLKLLIEDTSSGLNDSSIKSFEVLPEVECRESLFLPNAFSPNNSNLNEVFYPILKGNWQEYTIEVYNRLGELVYKSDDQGVLLNKWNEDRYTVSNVYTYIFSAVDEQGQTIRKLGNITSVK